MRAETLQALLRAQAESRPVALATELGGGERQLEPGAPAPPGGGEWLLEPGAPAPPGVPEGLHDRARDCLRSDRAERVELEGREFFVNVFNPPRRLVIVGAVHIAQALAPMAHLAGFEVVVVDPRDAFASEERFPGVAISRRWPDGALDELKLNGRTALVTLSHDPKLDDPALAAALRSEACYVGALGSRKTHAARLERLGREGFDAEQLARIRGPVGLDIGSRSPAEIAVSIVAEAIAAFRRR